jgi:hypothetical protein
MSILAILLAVAAPEAAVAATPEPSTKDVMVCRDQSRSNSRFTKKVCKRKSVSDAEEATTQREAGELINRPAINPSSGGG